MLCVSILLQRHNTPWAARQGMTNFIFFPQIFFPCLLLPIIMGPRTAMHDKLFVCLHTEFKQLREEFNIEMCVVAAAERTVQGPSRMLLSVGGREGGRERERCSSPSIAKETYILA